MRQKQTHIASTDSTLSEMRPLFETEDMRSIATDLPLINSHPGDLSDRCDHCDFSGQSGFSDQCEPSDHGDLPDGHAVSDGHPLFHGCDRSNHCYIRDCCVCSVGRGILHLGPSMETSRALNSVMSNQLSTITNTDFEAQQIHDV
jgi:hypothetical protein